MPTDCTFRYALRTGQRAMQNRYGISSMGVKHSHAPVIYSSLTYSLIRSPATNKPFSVRYARRSPPHRLAHVITIFSAGNAEALKGTSPLYKNISGKIYRPIAYSHIRIFAYSHIRHNLICNIVAYSHIRISGIFAYSHIAFMLSLYCI